MGYFANKAKEHVALLKQNTKNLDNLLRESIRIRAGYGNILASDEDLTVRANVEVNVWTVEAALNDPNRLSTLVTMLARSLVSQLTDAMSKKKTLENQAAPVKTVPKPKMPSRSRVSSKRRRP